MPRTYLARHELESVINVTIIIQEILAWPFGQMIRIDSDICEMHEEQEESKLPKCELD